MKITIFGFAGSGTSTIGKLLAQKISYNFMSSGNIMREWAKEKGYTIYEFEDKIIKKDDSFDLKLDKKVKIFGKENNNFIFESRLAWYFIEDSFKIYLYCEDEERYRRIHSREGGKIEDIKNKTKKRENELEERYKQIYPKIGFPPKRERFDLFIDATNKSPEEILKIILNKINI